MLKIVCKVLAFKQTVYAIPHISIFMYSLASSVVTRKCTSYEHRTNIGYIMYNAPHMILFGTRSTCRRADIRRDEHI